MCGAWITHFFLVRRQSWRKKKQRIMDSVEALQCSLQAMRECNEMCDISIISKEGKEFPAHRLILAASSPVFKAMVTQNFKELVTKVHFAYLIYYIKDFIIDLRINSLPEQMFAYSSFF